jgi:hypothetical protein
VASRFTSNPIICVALIVTLAMCATRIRSESEAPAADVSEEVSPPTREDLGAVPHRVRDHAGSARFVAQRRVRGWRGPR